MLTCEAAHQWCLKLKHQYDDYLPTSVVDLCFLSTPIRSLDDDSAWPQALVNYCFCIGMVQLNKRLAIGFMEEAGVDVTVIDEALKLTKDIRTEELIAIAPPTFNDDAKAWLTRGYESDRVGSVVVVSKREVRLLDKPNVAYSLTIGGDNLGEISYFHNLNASIKSLRI